MKVDPLKNTVLCHARGEIEGKEEEALIWLSKAAFDPSLVEGFFSAASKETSHGSIQLDTLIQHNDKYFNVLGSCDPKINPVFVKIIFPASENDIKKVFPCPSTFSSCYSHF